MQLVFLPSKCNTIQWSHLLMNHTRLSSKCKNSDLWDYRSKNKEASTGYKTCFGWLTMWGISGKFCKFEFSLRNWIKSHAYMIISVIMYKITLQVNGLLKCVLLYKKCQPWHPCLPCGIICTVDQWRTLLQLHHGCESLEYPFSY